VSKPWLLIIIVVCSCSTVSETSAQESPSKSSLLLNGDIKQSSGPLEIQQRKSVLPILPIPAKKNALPNGTSKLLEGEIRDARKNFIPDLKRASYELEIEKQRARNYSSKVMEISEINSLRSSSREIENQKQLAKQALQSELNKAEYLMNLELSRKGFQSSSLEIPHTSRRIIIPTIESQSVLAPPVSNHDLEAESRAGKASLIAQPESFATLINAQIPSLQQKALTHELNTHLTFSKAQNNLKSSSAQTMMLAELAQTKAISSLNTYAQFVVSETAADTQIIWDDWYYRFNKVAEPFLEKKLGESSFPHGKNTISITVTSAHKITVSLLSGENKEFNQAIVEAYLSLQSNSKLAFPSGTKRNTITFLLDNKFSGGEGISEIQSKSITGEKE